MNRLRNSSIALNKYDMIRIPGYDLGQTMVLLYLTYYGDRIAY